MQLLRYRDSLQNPPLLIVSDINTIIIRTNFTNLPTRTLTLTLDDMLKPESMAILRAVFFNPEELKPRETVAEVTREAARRFSILAQNLRKSGEDPSRVAHFLIRLLFCLFAEDNGLLPQNLFPRLLEQTRRNSRDFAAILGQLFQAMKGGGYFGAERILHFNGGLFDDSTVLQLDGDSMDVIAGIDALDWSAIEPSIFGTLFERGLDPAKRSQLGAHYTDKADILLIVEPVLMAPLRREWAQIQAEALRLKAEAEAAADAKKRAASVEKISALLRGFADRIAAVKVLDPACGSGNFLYVALQLLLDLQNEVINHSDELGAGRFFISVSPKQLFGIELNEYAHELAQVTIWIGYVQWMINHGYGYQEPILQVMDNIHHTDAILAWDEQGRASEPEWPQADVIIGNPPFLGGNKIRAELGDRTVEALFALYKDRVPAFADLVCYWFEKARAMIENNKVTRAGLLATQGIRGGANRKILERISETGQIFWAQSDRDWVLDGATVHVSMIGFDNGIETIKVLNDSPVQSINAALQTSVDITKATILQENANLAFIGDTKKGKFDITQDQAQEMRSSHLNPNGRPNSDVIKPWINGLDLTGRPRNMFIIDFGVEADEVVASYYEMPFEYVKRMVKPERDNVRNPREKRLWWIHGRPGPDLRFAISSIQRYIATPRVAKHRIFVFIPSETLPDGQVVVIARSDDYFIGVLHSKIHEIWSRAMGTQLRDAESGFRYSQTMTFQTFPLPWPPGKEPAGDARVEAIAQAARELVQKRDAWLHPAGASEAELKKRTLTNLYNARPTWLDLAHQRLDAAVFAAYGWPSDLSDEQILERLLALNLQRAGG